MQRRSEPRPGVIVLGCDEVGSAVAHRLHGDGFAVVLIDGVDPSWPRRGLAFTDAWYEGSTQLSGIQAVFCGSVRSIPAVLDRGHAVAATTWSWAGVASALSPVAVVETRAPSVRRTAFSRMIGPPLVTIEVVPGAIAGPEFDIAIRAPALPPARERVLYAPAEGRFGTHRAIGEPVRGGDVLGTVAGAAIIAPVDGCLRGLSARGARLSSGAELAEIDPRADATRCFGLDARATAIAAGVSEALRGDQPNRSALKPTRRVTEVP